MNFLDRILLLALFTICLLDIEHILTVAGFL